MSNIDIFILILVILLIIFLIKFNELDYFYNVNSYNSLIQYKSSNQTPQSNYEKIINKINYQDQYKKDLSVALNPIPTINCPELKDKDSCNKFGCNWFGNMCSSTYPPYY